MEKDEIKNIKDLYRKGLSMQQVAEKLKISASTVGYWLKKEGINRRSISDATTQAYITRFGKKKFAIKETLSSKDKELKNSGVVLYWGEGAKTGGVVKFANSDPEMIKLFLKFLREICGIDEERMKALMHIYPDHNYEDLKRFWMNVTKISEKNFYKPYIHIGRTGTYKKKSKYGTIAINYSDTKLQKLILEWIDDIKRKID